MQNCRFSIQQMVPLCTSTLVKKRHTHTRARAQRIGQAYHSTVKLATLLVVAVYFEEIIK